MRIYGIYIYQLRRAACYFSCEYRRVIKLKLRMAVLIVTISVLIYGVESQ